MDETQNPLYEIDWMFQSREVDDAKLIEVLVHEYYRDIICVAVSKTNDIPRAHTIAQETITQTVVDRYSFWGNQPVIDWLESLVDKVSTKLADKYCYFRDPASNFGQSVAVPCIPDEIPEDTYKAIISDIGSFVQKYRSHRKPKISKREFLMAGLGLATFIVIAWLGNLFNPETIPPEKTIVIHTVVVTRLVHQVIKLTPIPPAGEAILYYDEWEGALPFYPAHPYLQTNPSKSINHISPKLEIQSENFQILPLVTDAED